QELYAGYKKSLAGPSHLLGRMKQIWFYLAASFPGQQKIWKKIKKASTEEHYLAAIDIAMNSFSTATIDMLSK
ncbi:MAG: hypothetical protein KJ985_13055, partial [Proteobacteria bacterium]|nr:hypothetical protein [Pseudomonadota bacterium]